MKGIIFNITESFITDTYGQDTFDDIIQNCNLTTTDPFVGPGTYQDGDLFEIVAKSTERLNISIETFLKQLGQFSFSKLAERYPTFVTPYNHPKEFLKTVDGIIHVEVRKLYKDTQLPAFQYSEPNDDELIITYYSKRKLYPFMEGLINGVADYFDTSITQKLRIFEKEGTEFCDFHLKFG